MPFTANTTGPPVKVWSLLHHRKRNNNQGGLCFSTDSPHDRFGCSLARRLGLRAGGGTGLSVEAGLMAVSRIAPGLLTTLVAIKA